MVYALFILCIVVKEKKRVLCCGESADTLSELRNEYVLWGKHMKKPKKKEVCKMS